MVKQTPEPVAESVGDAGFFPATKWSLVLKTRESDAAGASKALGDLLQLYWRPLFVWARHSGCSTEDAEDAVQGFCETLIRRSSLQQVESSQGRLRSFLLASFRNHLNDKHRTATRQKRGGGVVMISLDGAEDQTNLAVSKSDPPDRAFERQWACTLLEHALSLLRQEYQLRGRGRMFELLEPALAWNGSEVNYAAAALMLGISTGAVQQQVKRMRVRFRTLLDSQINDTIGNPSEAAEEREHLIRILSET